MPFAQLVLPSVKDCLSYQSHDFDDQDLTAGKPKWLFVESTAIESPAMTQR
jgi:hypothetical protein